MASVQYAWQTRMSLKTTLSCKFLYWPAKHGLTILAIFWAVWSAVPHSQRNCVWRREGLGEPEKAHIALRSSIPLHRPSDWLFVLWSQKIAGYPVNVLSPCRTEAAPQIERQWWGSGAKANYPAYPNRSGAFVAFWSGSVFCVWALAYLHSYSVR